MMTRSLFVAVASFALLASAADTSSAMTPAPSNTAALACNPAHQYPAGQECISTAGVLSLVTVTGSEPTPATYACNPAHQYPAGQECISTAGTLSLVTVTGSDGSTTTTSSKDDSKSTKTDTTTKTSSDAVTTTTKDSSTKDSSTKESSTKSADATFTGAAEKLSQGMGVALLGAVGILAL